MTVGDFFLWWGRHLGGLLPEWLGFNWGPGDTQTTLAIDGDTVSIGAGTGTTPAIFDLSAGASGAAAELAAAPQGVRLKLAPTEFLVRRLTLPIAARNSLREAVGYQLPKLIPFSTEQVFFTCGLTEDSPPAGPLSVWLVAVPRRKVNQALALIEQEAPEDPISLKSPPALGEPLVFSWRVANRSSSATRRQRLLWLGVLGVWAVACGAHWYNKQAARDELTTTVAGLREQALQVGMLRENLVRTKTQLDWLNEKKQDMVSSLELLDLLTNQLEDDTWISSLELQGDKLSLQGVSPTPASLIEKLQDAALLHEVRFESAITQDARSTGSRFSISAKVRRPAAGSEG